MKNLFKKTLACCLAVCMVLTLCVGALTVNAEAVSGTVTVGTVDITDAATTADVDVTVDTDALAAAEVVVNVPNGLTIAGLSFAADEDVEITYASAANPTGAPVALSEAEEFVAPNVEDGKFIYIIHLPAGETTSNAVVLTITFAGTFTVGKIDVTVDKEATEACFDDKSDLISLAFVDGAINVKTAHVCEGNDPVRENEVAATCYAEGSYDEVVYCTCGKELSRTAKTIEKIAHTPAAAVVENEVAATCYAEGSYDSVVYCAVEACKAELSRTPVTVDKTEHTPAEAVVENEVAATCYAEGSYDSVVYCSVAECKHEISRTPVTVEKIAHTPAEAVEENRVEAKPGVAGSYDSVVYCAVEACKAEISRTTMEIPALPEEIVPVEDASIVVRDAGVSITSTLDMRVRVRKSVIPADCARAELIVTPTVYDGSYNPVSGTTFVESFDMADAPSNLVIYPSNFSLYALDLPMYVQIKCYDANGNLYKYSPEYTYYPAEALKAQYSATATTTSDKALNTIVTDMLNMSAAAQTYFASNAGAASALKATVAAGNLVNKDWPQNYATTTEPDYNTISNKIFAEGLTDTTNELRIGADLSGAPILSYSLRKAKTLYPDHSKLSMTVSYTTYYGKAAGGEVVTDTIEGDEWAQYVSGNHLVYKFRDCAMYDGNKTITVVVNYDGKQIVKSEYSLESYIAANSNDTSGLANCLKGIGIFGASARAYFSTMGTVDPA